MELFEWDEAKNEYNQKAHKISFEYSQRVFLDPKRLIAKDEAQSKTEERLFCIGKIDNKIITARFTYRNEKIRILGAGFWRKGRKAYEKENRI